jgi:hypothetical protein
MVGKSSDEKRLKRKVEGEDELEKLSVQELMQKVEDAAVQLNETTDQLKKQLGTETEKRKHIEKKVEVFEKALEEENLPKAIEDEQK